MHTPEPWFVLPNASCVAGPLVPGTGDTPEQATAGIAYCAMRLRALEEATENARRIVACVNALEGIETKALEALERKQFSEIVALMSLGPKRGMCAWCGLELYGETGVMERIRRHTFECEKNPLRALLATCEAIHAARYSPESLTAVLDGQLLGAITSARGD